MLGCDEREEGKGGGKRSKDAYVFIAFVRAINVRSDDPDSSL